MIQVNNLFKYLIMFLVTTISAKLIPSCGVLQEHAMYIGLIFSILLCSIFFSSEKDYKLQI